MIKLSKRQWISISIIKSMIVNYVYFGWQGVFHFYILCARNVKLYKLKGDISVIGDIKPYFGCISIGLPENSLFDNSTVWENNGHIEIELPCCIGKGNRISNYGVLTLGENFHMTSNSSLICYKKIKFGKNNLISWDCLFMDTDFHKIIDSNERIINEPEEIIIGDKVWVCCSCKILKGSRIPHDSIVAAGALISRKMSENNCVIGSNKVLKRGVNWIG